MSLVIVVGNKDFILCCGEQKVQYPDGTIGNNFRKVIRLNDHCILCMTGTLEYIAILTNPIFKNNNEVREDIQKLNYNEINYILEKRYNELINYVEDNKDVQLSKMFVTIAGFDGASMRMDSYTYPINKDTHYTLTNESYRVITMEVSHEDLHHRNFLDYCNKTEHKTIRNFKNAFKDTVEKGIKLDDSINDNYTFEIIRKKGVL